MNHVKCGRCVRCGREYPAVPNLTNCECGGILDIIYDYDRIRTVLTRETLKNRTERSMWRYRELLPVEPETPAPPLRVGWSPLYEADRLAKELGIAKLWVKDDGQNPTASLKDRASAMAVAKAQEAGAHVIACSSTGNAASSLAGNAAAAGLQTFIFVPSRAPKGKVARRRRQARMSSPARPRATLPRPSRATLRPPGSRRLFSSPPARRRARSPSS